MKRTALACAVLALLATVLPAYAQSAPPATISSCAYAQTSRDYFACPSGPSAQFVVAPNAPVEYTFSYTANLFAAGALQAFSPQVFITAQLAPSDISVHTSAGIAFF